MAMMIKILNDNQSPLCIYDGHRWAGNTNPRIISEAIMILTTALGHSREIKLLDRFFKKPEDQSESAKD